MRTLKLSLLLSAIVVVIIASCTSNIPVVHPTAIILASPIILPTTTFTYAPEPTNTPTVTPTNTPIPTMSKIRIDLSSELYLDENSSPDNLRGEPYHYDHFCFQHRNGIGCVDHFGNEEWVTVQTWTHIVPFADFHATPESGEGLRQNYFQVWRDGKLMYSSPTDSMWNQGSLLRYEDHWILWFTDHISQSQVVQDGVLLNDQYDYDRAFSVFLLDEKPFFFFQRGNQFGISFNNQEILLPYSNISLDKVCCEGGGRRNPRGTNSMVGFYAQRENSEYQYIEIGLK